MMNTEKTRLENMLRDNKISREDYDILASALKRKSFFTKMQSSLLLNPFQKIAGLNALVLGMIILFMTSYIGLKADVYFLSPLSVINASALAKQTFSHPFLFLVLQNTISWLTLSLLYILITKLLQKNKIRIIDFLGTVSLARFPILLITLYTYLIRVFFPSLLRIDFSNGYQIHWSMTQYLISVPITGLAIWQGFVYFYALKESSGLNGKKLWGGFLAAIVLGEFIAQPITTLMMN